MQELLSAGGSQTPRSAHEVIAHLIGRLSRWDDRFILCSNFYHYHHFQFIFLGCLVIEIKYPSIRKKNLRLFCVIMTLLFFTSLKLIIKKVSIYINRLHLYRFDPSYCYLLSWI